MNIDKATTFNPFLVVVFGDFNVKPCNWCINDKTNFRGAKIDTLTIESDLLKIIKEPRHILDISSSCIDLNYYIPHETIIFDDQDPSWINNRVEKAIQEKNQVLAEL